jgi:hypothetical protein
LRGREAQAGDRELRRHLIFMLKTRSTVEIGQAFRLRSLNFQEKDDQNSSFEVQVLDRRAQAASAPGKNSDQNMAAVEDRSCMLNNIVRHVEHFKVPTGRNA